MNDTSYPLRRPWTSRAILLVLVLGALYRLVPVFRNPSLIVDDAMLALNVGTRSFAGLLHPLALEQSAAPGFLWALKVMTLLAGMNDLALRALPIAAALVLPYACWRFARRLMGDVPAIFVASLAAFSPIILQYSVSAKPYVLDALAGVVILDLTLTVTRGPSGARGWWRLAGAGVLALLFSTPSVFMLAGSLATLATVPEVRRTRALPLLAVGSLWLAVFAGIYLTITRPESGTPYMRTFWAARFTPWTAWAHPAEAWNVLKRLPAGTLLTARGLSEPTLLLWALVAAGGWRVAKRGFAPLALVLTPVLAILGAATLGLYPVSPRLDLFAAPAFFVLFGAALDWGEGFPQLGKVATRAAAAMAVLITALQGVKLDAWAPALRPISRTFAEESGAREPVYVFSNAIPAWTWYTTNWRNPDRARLDAILATQRADGEAFANAASRGRAVADTEGAGLLIGSGAPVEVLGLAPGMQYREGAMFDRAEPDSGWATREAARIRSVAASDVWIVVAPANSRAARDLLTAVHAAGGHEGGTWAEHQAVLYRMHFGP